MTDKTVSTKEPGGASAGNIAENLRLCLSKLGQLGLPVNPINYGLFYFYVAGEDVELNRRLDELISDKERWSDEQAKELFSQYICECDGSKNQAMEQELVGTVAEILGMVIDLSGKTAISSDSLETLVVDLAACKDPVEVLKTSSRIISETRRFVDETKKFESVLRESTQQIEDLKDELENARKQATVDSLTGLNNRRGFDQAMQQAIESVEAGGSAFSLMILDIDNFKTVNDTYGHLVGDKVLMGIANQLHKQMRGNDYLSRFGGEEFAILLLGTPITGAFTVAENLRKSIERLRLKHTKTGQLIGKVTISTGVACIRPDEASEDLIQRCDRALYRAKSLGRDRTVIAD